MNKIDGYKEDLVALQNKDYTDQELNLEREKMLDIQQVMLPNEKIMSTNNELRNKARNKQFQMVQRFDPTAGDMNAHLIQKDEQKKVANKAPKTERKDKKEFGIVQGIDERSKKIKMADEQLAKREKKAEIQEDKARIKKLRKKEIDYEKLKNIAKEDNMSGFKLFG